VIGMEEKKKVNQIRKKGIMCNFVEMLWKKDKNQEEHKVIHCQQPKEKNF
jgi:hypothetical protein